MKLLMENWKRFLNESQIRRLGLNTFPYGQVDLALVRKEYPDLQDELYNFVALSMIETYESGHFFKLMKMIDQFVEDNGYNGIVLRAQTQDVYRVPQEKLIALYERAGYHIYPPKVQMKSYSDDDVFMIKRFSK